MRGAEIPLAINTPGGTPGCRCSHINQDGGGSGSSREGGGGGGGQVTEPTEPQGEIENEGRKTGTEEKKRGGGSWDSPPSPPPPASPLLREFTFSPSVRLRQEKTTTLMEGEKESEKRAGGRRWGEERTTQKR